MPLPPRSYKKGEYARRLTLIAKSLRTEDPRLEAQIDEIEHRAEQRARIEMEAQARAELEAEKALAEAKAAERTVGARGKAAARKAVADAQVQLRATKAAARYRNRANS